MAYIGRQLVRGQNRVLDDISSSFNGSTTAFNLTVSSSSSPPASVNQLWIIIGGILQKPGTDFTVADAVITFTTAPASTLSFWGMIQGDTSDINSPADASVTPSKIANSGDFAFPADVRFKDADASHYVGFQAPSTVSSNLVWTLPAADGSANQILKTDGSGALGWASDSATDSTKMPLAGGTFTGDVTFDGATAGRDIVWDKSDNALEFADNAKGIFGTGADLEVYHDATDNQIKSTNGKVVITTTAGNSDIEITPNGSGNVKLDGLDWPNADGSANQYLKTDGSGALSWSTVTTTALTGSTNNTICTVTGANAIQGEGNLTYDGSILDCTGKLRVDISTTGTAGSGSAEGIFLRNTNETDNNAVTIFAGADDYANAASAINFVNVDHSANAGNIAFDTRNGSNSYATRLTITSDGHIDIPDNGKIRLGTGNDLAIYHSTDNLFDSYGQNVKFRNRNTDGGVTENMLTMSPNGSVHLFIDNIQKLQTHSSYGTILSNTTDDANETNVLTLARRGYEASGYGVNFKVKGGSASGQNGLVMQVSQGSGGYSDKFRFDNDGLKFGSDTAAANALNDYEEGYYTPVISAGTSGSISYGSGQVWGKYTKAGNICHCSFDVELTAWSGASGVCQVSLPLQARNWVSGTYGWSYDSPNFWSVNTNFVGSEYNRLTGYIQGGGTTILLYVLNASNSLNSFTVNTTGRIAGSITYHTLT